MTDEQTGRRAGQAQGGYWYARAIFESDLPSPSRLVALVLVAKADNATGKIVIAHSAIAHDAGLGKSTVDKHLRHLEEAGFIRRRRPQTWQSLGRGEMTEYTLVIPHGYQMKSAPTYPTSWGTPTPKTPPNGVPLPHLVSEKTPPRGDTTKGLTSPRSADAGAGVDGLPASPPECDECGLGGNKHARTCSQRQIILCAGTCGQEIPWAAIVMEHTCKACGHQHTYEEYYPTDEAQAS